VEEDEEEDMEEKDIKDVEEEDVKEVEEGGSISILLFVDL
jgi:hypothetical protein